MIDEAIKPNDILRVVAVHDSPERPEAFRHSHWARPSAHRRQQEQCYPNRGTLNMFSHGPSHVAGSIIEVVDVRYRVPRVHFFQFCGLRRAPTSRLLIGTRSQRKQCFSQLYEIKEADQMKFLLVVALLGLVLTPILILESLTQPVKPGQA
jgi:hypothetical protein